MKEKVRVAVGIPPIRLFLRSGEQIFFPPPSCNDDATVRGIGTRPSQQPCRVRRAATLSSFCPFDKTHVHSRFHLHFPRRRTSLLWHQKRMSDPEGPAQPTIGKRQTHAGPISSFRAEPKPIFCLFIYYARVVIDRDTCVPPSGLSFTHPKSVMTMTVASPDAFVAEAPARPPARRAVGN